MFVTALNIIADFICLIMATFGAFAIAGFLKEIRDNQTDILHEIDIIQEQLSNRQDGADDTD